MRVSPFKWAIFFNSQDKKSSKFAVAWLAGKEDHECADVDWKKSLYDVYMGVSKNRGGPKSGILIEFSIIFTIHFGGPPLFLETPMPVYVSLVEGNVTQEQEVNFS